jgi:hypothetical protein
MSRSKLNKELLTYIARLNNAEQTELLGAFKNRELLQLASGLDSKQKNFNKGRKMPSMAQIVKTITEVRREDAKKAA